MKNLENTKGGIIDLKKEEMINVNGGGQMVPASLIGGDTAAAGAAIRYAAGYVIGTVLGFF